MKAKKKVAMVLSVLALTVLTACDKDEEENNHSSISSTSDNDEISVSESNEESAVASSESDDDSFFDLYGIKLLIPSEYQSENIYSKRVWSGLSNGKQTYLDIDFLLDYGTVASSDSYNLDDTPEIMWEYILEVVDGFYPAGESKSTYSVDSEEKRTMIGYDVIRRTGTIHAEKYGETHELKYAAYYGLFDLQNGAYQKIPTVWIAFSETEGTSDLEDVVDTAFDNAKLSN